MQAAEQRCLHFVLRRAQDMKESMCYCSYKPLSEMPDPTPLSYILPDGNNVAVHKFANGVPETLLAPSGDFPGVPALLAASLAEETRAAVKRPRHDSA
eukprot:2047780-Amphidinium_carterae.1